MTTATAILLRISEQLVTIPVTDGTEIIPNARDLFTIYIDPDFKNWGADEVSEDTPELQIALYEIAQDATFEQIFSSLRVDKDNLCLAQSQIITFVKMHREYLRTDGRKTFFLFKSKGKFFVASVYFGDAGCLMVFVRRLNYGRVWDVASRLRVVVPQL